MRLIGGKYIRKRGRNQKSLINVNYRALLTLSTRPRDDVLVWVTAENGREVRYYREPLAGFWLRFSGRFFYMFIPESML